MAENHGWRGETEQEAAIRFAQQAAEYAASRAVSSPRPEEEPVDAELVEDHAGGESGAPEGGHGHPDAGEPDDVYRPPTFRERVDLKVPLLRYANNLHRVIHTPQERERLRQVDRRAAVWVPLATVGIIGFCAVIAVALAVRIIGDDTTSAGARSLTVVVVAGVVVGCFVLLLRSQDHWENLRPHGRVVRTDVADAYETVRDAPFVLVELGVNDERLGRVVDLLPIADRLVDFMVEHQATSTMPIKGHPVYEELIRMAAEVQVIVEMRQEALGHRAPVTGQQWWNTRVPARGEIAGFDSLADIAETIGPARALGPSAHDDRGNSRGGDRKPDRSHDHDIVQPRTFD